MIKKSAFFFFERVGGAGGYGINSNIQIVTFCLLGFD